MSDKFNSKGYFIPEFAEPDNCNGCMICGQLCPDFAIEVFRFEKVKD
jgi:2-oxoglutarate ferredoxin oxidoreductase subunit delta